MIRLIRRLFPDKTPDLFPLIQRRAIRVCNRKRETVARYERVHLALMKGRK